MERTRERPLATRKRAPCGLLLVPVRTAPSRSAPAGAPLSYPPGTVPLQPLTESERKEELAAFRPTPDAEGRDRYGEDLWQRMQQLRAGALPSRDDDTFGSVMGYEHEQNVTEEDDSV